MRVKILIGRPKPAAFFSMTYSLDKCLNRLRAFLKSVLWALLPVLFAGVSVNATSAELFTMLKDPQLRECVANIAKRHKWHVPAEVLRLKCHSKGIQSIVGLEEFVNLEKLSLYNNQIDHFEVPSLKHLEHLNVARNSIHRLRLEGLNKLFELYAFDNPMSELVLLNLPSLTKAKLNDNRLVKFEHAGLTALTKIYLFNNELEHMDINNMPSLIYMDVRQNPMPDGLYEDMDKMEGVTIFHDGNEEDWQ